jgi:hypothetical protein
VDTKELYSLLADFIVAIHFGYVAFVVVGQLLIVVGVLLGWRWVRNPWFRWIHLLAIVFVAAETITHINCPLTDWEDDLRAMAGVQVEHATFIGRLCHSLFRIDLPYDHWAFQFGYIGFAVLVLLTFALAPPRLRRKPPVGHRGDDPVGLPHTGVHPG